MNFTAQGGAAQLAITIVAFAFLCTVTYFFFIGGERFVQFFGESGIKVVTRMMGLILAVIGAQMVIAGVTNAIQLGG